jgi:two-component system NarL family sensor kinase
LSQVNQVTAELREGYLSEICYLVAYGVAGAFLLDRRPDLPFGWLLSGTAAILAVSIAISGPSALAISRGNTSSLALWGVTLGQFAFLQVAVQGLINVRFPTGRVTTRWARILDRLMITGIVLATISAVFGTTIAPQLAPGTPSRDLANPLTSGTVAQPIANVLQIAVPLIVLLGLIAGLRIVVLARRAEGIERRQLQWRAFGVLFSLALFPFAVSDVLPSFIDCLDGVLFVATLAIPVLRYRLWEIDTIIRRSAVYILVTVVLVGGYVAIAAIGAALASDRVGFLVAAVAVAAAYGPARSRSQRIVDHVFYGQRNDPYQALREVSVRLEVAAEPGKVLTAVVTAVAESLRLPYVAIERPADGERLAVYGDASVNGIERWPLMYQGAFVGALVASRRRGETSFDDRDRAVLADLARQSGAAVHAEALTADLIESRQRLVTAREDERRRLRRDLHDGLGPMLTGLGLNVDAARAQLHDPQRVDVYLAQAKEASTQAIADLRNIVYGLRPPALDDLGLVGAVRMQVARLVEGSPVAVRIDSAELPDLPAAVEVAAFRTAIEAVTNVIRHSAATQCVIRLDVDVDAMVVDVSDNGIGLSPWTAGVGLLAMRERAAELGGTLRAGPTPDGGCVCACFPVTFIA